MTEKCIRIKDEEDALLLQLYFDVDYVSWAQLALLSQQLREVKRSGSTSVLETGKGNGLVSDYLRKAGLKVTTIDINPALEPDLPEVSQPSRFARVCADWPNLRFHAGSWTRENASVLGSRNSHVWSIACSISFATSY